MADRIDPLVIATSVTNAALGPILDRIQFAKPPSMVRVEPDSITGDPAPGAEARTADPAWMLGRQWQFGELAGEDAGYITGQVVCIDGGMSL